jgi:filamentous hemagglutinin family protein
MRLYRTLYFVFLTSMFAGSSTAIVQAQSSPIRADLTLNTQVQNADALNFVISGGRPRGGNLFHSFSAFSIPTGGSATFNNGLSVSTIFARVTGGNVSAIDGLIKAQGNSSLFLVNPAGIIFGPNARLDLGGSFLGTTATGIEFADGLIWPAQPTNAPPILTISAPVGVQFGRATGSIQINGQGHNVTGNTRSLIRSRLTVPGTPGLSVGADRTLGLIGNGVQLAGGAITATQGNVQLGSVESGVVKLVAAGQGWQANYGGVNAFADIGLTQQSIVDGSGQGGSQINLTGRNINLSDGSLILMQNRGARDSGPIRLNATESIRLIGTTPDAQLQTGIHRQQLGTGQGGSLTVQAANLDLQQGGAILAKTFTTANNGDVLLKVDNNINVAGFSPIDAFKASEIVNYSMGQGQSGNLAINTGNLTIVDGALVGIGTFSQGATNNITVQATGTVDIAGEEPKFTQFSSLFAISFGEGNAGNINLNAKNLAVRLGARIGSSTFGEGQAGNLIVNTSDSVLVSGRAPIARSPSLLSSSASTLPPALRPLYGVTALSNGDAGSVVVNTNQLTVTRGGLVAARNQGNGNAGKVMIEANRVDITAAGGITASTVTGDGGNLEITAKDLIFMRDRGTITGEAKGAGNGGNLLLRSPIIFGTENSDIIAKAQRGNGGNIQIFTQSLLGLVFRPLLTPANDITASSDLGLSGTVNISGPNLSPNPIAITLASDLVDPNEKIAAGCTPTQTGRFIITGRGGLPVAPEKPVSERSWMDIRSLDLTASTAADRQSNMMAINQADHPTIEQRLQEAIGLERQADGTIALINRTYQAQPTMAIAQPITCAPGPAS